MKEGVSPAEQIKWQKGVIANQLKTIESKDREIEYWITERNALQKRVIALQDEVERLKHPEPMFCLDCLEVQCECE